MAITRSQALNNIYTSTWQARMPSVPDQIFSKIGLLAWLRSNGGFQEQRGGLFVEFPLAFSDPALTTWVVKGAAPDIADWEELTDAKYDWKYATFPIPRFFVDDQQNAGSETRFLNLIDHRMGTAESSIRANLNTALFAAAPATAQIVGLQRLVMDDPTSSTSIGEINQSTYSWWQNKKKDMAGLSFYTNFIPEARTLWNNCSNNLAGDEPDILVAGQTVAEYYEAVVDDRVRFGNERMLELGFHNILFNGAPMIWDGQCANTRCYFLNTSHLKLVVDPAHFFRMTDWKVIPAQVDDWVAHIVLACAFVTNNRRVQGVMHTIDTP